MITRNAIKPFHARRAPPDETGANGPGVSGTPLATRGAMALELAIHELARVHLAMEKLKSSKTFTERQGELRFALQLF